MILRVLEQLESVSSIGWFERPDLPHERFKAVLGKSNRGHLKRNVHNKLDFGLFEALRDRRLRVSKSLKLLEPDLRTWVSAEEEKPILLDFNPFYVPPVDVVKNSIYWYDLIDNFTKHNRFSPREIRAVEDKYQFVKSHADLVTGVTQASVDYFGGRVLANRLLRQSIGETNGTPEYDLGFIGFITDKFDVDAVRSFASAGLTVVVCGHAYDPWIVKELQAIPGVTYLGAFRSEEVPSIISKFRVGMVPYRVEKSHDESPIKFFQYLAHGRPALLSSRFNSIEAQFTEAVCYYNSGNFNDAIDYVRSWRKEFSQKSNAIRRKALTNKDLFWDGALQDVLSAAAVL
jgi:hypothetical protein